MCGDQGVRCSGEEREQLLSFSKPYVDVCALPNSCLTSQLCFTVLSKCVLGHATKGGEAVNRGSQRREKWLVSENGSSAGPESALSLLCEST